MTDIKILVVDADQASRRTLASGLRRLGFHVIEASDGQGARHALASTSVDAVVADLMLPSVAGLRLVRRVAHERPEMPLVLTTSYRLSHDQIRRVAGNVRAVALKPAPAATIAAFVDKALTGHRGA